MRKSCLYNIDEIDPWLLTQIRIVNNPKSEFEMATDLASSSTSSSPAVLKIVIDLDEYHRLLDIKEHLDRQEKKLSSIF